MSDLIRFYASLIYSYLRPFAFPIFDFFSFLALLLPGLCRYELLYAQFVTVALSSLLAS